jgi:hypothetical protein
MKVPLIAFVLGRRADHLLTWKFAPGSISVTSANKPTVFKPKITDPAIAYSQLVKWYSPHADKVEVTGP